MMTGLPPATGERLAHVLGEVPGMLATLPSPVPAFAATLYLFESGRLRWRARAQPGDVARANGSHVSPERPQSAYLVVGKRQVVIILQFLVGSLVTFGGAAFTLLAVNPSGTALGLGHLSIGVAGLLVGILAVTRSALPFGTLLAINGVTIAYSLLSVSIAAIQSLLPVPALHDSLIGTFVAVVMSGALIYLLPRGKR
jgi:hypothetical protein